MGADVKANTGGGGALQLLDLRLLEDGGERGGALDSDVVAVETAVEERSEDVREQPCQGALTRKGCGGALEVGDRRLLEDVSERGKALNSNEVAFETASEGCDGDGEREACQRALTQERTLAVRAHLSDVSAAAEGSNLLNTIAPGTPMSLISRLSSVMLFLRKEMSGIPQKSVIMACSSTAVARWPAASPVMLLTPTL